MDSSPAKNSQQPLCTLPPIPTRDVLTSTSGVLIIEFGTYPTPLIARSHPPTVFFKNKIKNNQLWCKRARQWHRHPGPGPGRWVAEPPGPLREDFQVLNPLAKIRTRTIRRLKVEEAWPWHCLASDSPVTSHSPCLMIGCRRVVPKFRTIMVPRVLDVQRLQLIVQLAKR